MFREMELARRSDGGIEIRPGALRVRWELSDLATADGHVARGTFAASVRALAEPTELRMLDEAFAGSNGAVTTVDVERHFADAVTSRAKQFAAALQAAPLIAEEGRRGLSAALMEAARAVAFSCGLEVLQPAEVELDCPTLARQRMEEMDRQAAQKRVSEQLEQVRRSAALLKEFESARAACPELAPGQILSRMASADQADAVRAMILASAQSARASRLWVAAGESLVRVEGRESVRAEIVRVSAKLGPLRSVRGDGEGGLLLGCQAGVLRIHPDSPAMGTEYSDPEVNSRLGFNSTVLLGDQLWAAHSEAGLVCWKLSEPEKPARVIRSADASIKGFAPRNLVRLDQGRILFSSGGRLGILTGEGNIISSRESAAADIAAVFVRKEQALTAQTDGQVCAWSADLTEQCAQRRSGRIAAAAALPWVNDVRILMATEGGPIVCVGPEDEVMTQYTCAYSGMRMIAAADDLIAAVTADRQRLVLWHPWDGKKPFADLFVYGLARHRIADVWV